MKCSNPDCTRGIGLVAYQRGWFSKRRYCSKHCRDALLADSRKVQQRRSVMAYFERQLHAAPAASPTAAWRRLLPPGVVP
jgi:hypothetical protein